jgi:hypothetical protein
MNIELWRNVKIVDTSATATKRLIKIIAVSLVTAILLGTTIGHTKIMDNIFNNAGNIEQGQGFAGETGETYANDRDTPFVVFDTPQMGMRAIFRDIKTKIKKHDGLLWNIVSEYAPPSENNTDLYYEKLKAAVNGDTMINESHLIPIVRAIIMHENKPEVSKYYLSNPKLIQEAYQLSTMSFDSGTSYEKAMEIYQSQNN